MIDSSINHIINHLESHRAVYEKLFLTDSEALIYWKPDKDKWCLLEIVCHLIDEEIEDFRYRVKHTLTTPDQPAPPIDPVGWPTSKKYFEQDFKTSVSRFLEERDLSINWLRSIKNGNWTNEYKHPQIGNITAKQFLANWLAHDYLHIRQIMKLKFQYLEHVSGEDLSYAGEL